jgi:hypothetical protein
MVPTTLHTTKESFIPRPPNRGRSRLASKFYERYFEFQKRARNVNENERFIDGTRCGAIYHPPTTGDSRRDPVKRAGPSPNVSTNARS